ncbi:hypothetical protein PMI09_04229 [Rhizobium sp. CF122]|nr:hypothetical protein PMI09_04229 [Rhizobium sp. CF122]
MTDPTELSVEEFAEVAVLSVDLRVDEKVEAVVGRVDQPGYQPAITAYGKPAPALVLSGRGAPLSPEQPIALPIRAALRSTASGAAHRLFR